MTRRSSAASLALATTLAAGAAVPASAGHTYVCVFEGAATFDQGRYYVGIGPSVSTDLISWSATGTCVFLFTPWHLHGWCGNSAGDATVDDGSGTHSGSFVEAGSVAVFTGGITGTVQMTPAPGESCIPGGPGADTFLVTGSFAFS